MGDGRDVLDHGHFQTHGLQGADGGLTTLARALDENLNGLQAMLHGGLGGGLGGALCGEGGGLLAAAEAQAAGGSPGQCVALAIGHGDHGVVEGRTDMDLALFDVLLLTAAADDLLTGLRISHILSSLLTSSCWRWSFGAIAATPLLRVLAVVLTPVNFLFTQWKKLLRVLLRHQDDDGITEEELMGMVDQAETEGSLDQHESDLIRNAIEFNDMEVSEILTPRVDLEALADTATMEEAAAMYASSGFSRLPIYHDSIDNIIGVLHEKDFYAAYCRGAKRLSELKSSVLYTTETARISDLLRQLQQNKVHMAVVVDEYGGTQGIVTMEDIMEELVGEIWDEHDEVIEEFRKQSDGSYLVACSADLDDLYDLFDMKPSEEYDASSVSGWVMEEIGRVPDVGDRFRADGLEVCVTRVEHRRVMEIRVRRLPKGDAAPEKVHAHSGI